MRAPLAMHPSYRQGLLLDQRGDHAAAAEAFRVAVTQARIQRAEFHRKLSAAIARLREVVRRSPDAYEEHFNLGVNLQNKYWALHLDLGVKNPRLFALAEHHFLEAMRLAPSVANPLVCLAALYAQAGDRARAQETIAGLARRPVRPGDLYNLAFFHKVMGDLEEAYRVLRQAFDHDARHRDWVRESDDFAEYLEDPRLVELMRLPEASRLRLLKPGLLRLQRLQRPKLLQPLPAPVPVP
jgi:tetratricopeptide (TPR) repeat protein